MGNSEALFPGGMDPGWFFLGGYSMLDSFFREESLIPSRFYGEGGGGLYDKTGSQNRVCKHGLCLYLESDGWKQTLAISQENTCGDENTCTCSEIPKKMSKTSTF